nr:hypothetical protein BCU64_00645 [Vibrio lentus]
MISSKNRSRIQKESPYSLSTGFFVHDKNEDTDASEYEGHHQTKRIQESRQYLQLPTEKTKLPTAPDTVPTLFLYLFTA